MTVIKEKKESTVLTNGDEVYHQEKYEIQMVSTTIHNMNDTYIYSMNCFTNIFNKICRYLCNDLRRKINFNRIISKNSSNSNGTRFSEHNCTKNGMISSYKI